MPDVKCFFIGDTDDADMDKSRMLESGAMWYAPTGYASRIEPHTPDKRILCVKLPNGHTWVIDHKANNCTRKDDYVHRCWVRHGEPPNITVDKNGDTCGCGCSIQSGDYHGFLRNGVLVDA
ncbi:MAG TPA: hypothetical protein VGL56_10275 [Fimbriimonadaceae bacterium]